MRSLFCAATERKPTLNLNWRPYFDIADREDLTFDEKLVLYDEIAREHYDTEAFDAFCAEHLPHLDAVALEYFGSDAFKRVVRAKVADVFPAHEVARFSRYEKVSYSWVVSQVPRFKPRLTDAIYIYSPEQRCGWSSSKGGSSNSTPRKQKRRLRGLRRRSSRRLA